MTTLMLVPSGTLLRTAVLAGVFVNNQKEVRYLFESLVLPTTPTIYRIDEIAADPIALKARLGTYTNFVNVLDATIKSHST